MTPPEPDLPPIPPPASSDSPPAASTSPSAPAAASPADVPPPLPRNPPPFASGPPPLQPGAPPSTTEPVLPPVPIHPSGDDKIWIVACHLSLLLGVGVLLPLIIFLAKQRDSPLIAAHAKEALNFHLSLLIYAFGAGASAFLCLGCITVPLLALLGTASVILAIVAAVEASQGRFYRYPLCLRLIP